MRNPLGPPFRVQLCQVAQDFAALTLISSHVQLSLLLLLLLLLLLHFFKQPPAEPIFLVKHTGTIDPQELFEEMKTEVADVEEDYLEMVSHVFSFRKQNSKTKNKHKKHTHTRAAYMLGARVYGAFVRFARVVWERGMAID